MKGGILCAGGAGPQKQVLSTIDLSKYEITAAADSGYHLAKEIGLHPDLIIGDMDSIGMQLEEIDGELHSFSHDKDYTDTQLGCMALQERGCDSLLILGGGEGRLDHTLGLYHYFSTLARHMFIHWITRCEHIWFIHRNTIQLTGVRQSRISLFPYGQAAYNTEGLQWGTEQAPYSLSNRLFDTVCSITVKQGVLIVLMPIEEGYISYQLGQ